MPTALKKGGDGEASNSRQHAATTNHRLGQAPSSLRVQLPVASSSSATSSGQTSDLLSSLLPSRPSPASAVNGCDPSSTRSASSRSANLLPPPQTSDAAFLASSLLAQQARAREIQAVQDSLIAPTKPLSKTDLKKALTRFSAASWLQVLQERALAGLCGYPLCSKPLSASQSQRPGGRFRISVARGTIEPDTRNDPGGRNGFCSDVCHARAEWVRRWVLNPGSARDDSQADQNGSIQDLSDFRKPSTEQRLQGGKWEALTHRREDQWAEIELLEDLEEGGELEGWEGFDHIASNTSESTGSSLANTTLEDLHTPTQQDQQEAKRVPTASAPAAGTTKASEPLPSSLANLRISERGSSAMPRPSDLGAKTTLPQRQIFVSSGSLHRGGGNDLFDDLLGGDDSGMDDGRRESSGSGAAARLGRSIEQANHRIQAGSLPVASQDHAEKAGSDEIVEEEGEQDLSPEQRAEARVRAAEETETKKMLDEAMQLRDEMIGRGEWQD